MISEQMKNLGIKPFTAKMKEIRAKSLAKEFPQYSEHFLHEFVETDPMIDGVFNPNYSDYQTK